MKFHFIILIILLLINIELQGAENYFSSLTSENGLPSNVTNSIVQDPRGFIWIGTENGLCRYDGYNMTLFNKESPHKLPSNKVSALLLDGETIWVGTWDKLCTINTVNFEINVINETKIHTVRTLYKDRNDKIWIGTNSGLFIYNKENNSFKHFNNKNSNLSHNTVRAFCEDKESNMWIGTYDMLNKFNGVDFEVFNLKGNYKSSITNNLILAIEDNVQSDSLLLVGTETGLCLFNRHTKNFKCYNSQNSSLSNEVIKSIYCTQDKLWLGTDFGLNVFNYRTKTIESYFHNPLVNHTICNNVIWKIFKDENNILWFITSNGISLLEQMGEGYSLHKTIFEVDGIKIGNQVRDLLIEDNGTKWLATNHGVICEKLNGKRETFTSESELSKRLLIDNVYALEIDNYGQIWIGTAGGINIWNPFEKKMYAITANKYNGLTSNYIKDFIKSPNGEIWVSAWEGGLFQTNGHFNITPEITFTQITGDGEALACFTKNKFFYTSNLSLIKYNPFTKKSKIIIDTIHESTILNLKSDSSNNLWIVSKDELIRYRTIEDKLEHFPFKEPTSQIMSIEVDKNGNFWASTHNSILKFNQLGQQILSLPLNSNAPIKNLQLQSSCQANDGSLYFGGHNGYIKVDPNLEIKPGRKIETNISGLAINNEVILPNDKNQLLPNDITYHNNLSLTHNNNSLTFQFSNLDYWLPELNSYKYRLLGYENQWQYTSGDKNFAIYSNLKPKNYTLEVIGFNHKGIVCKNTAQLQIKINPPIWLSNGFIVLYIFIFLSIAYIIFKIYSYRNKITNQLKITQLEKEHSDQLLKTKQQFFTNISHEFRTPLSLINPPIKQVLITGAIDETSRHMLQLAHKNSNRLMQLVNQILDFRKLETTDLSLDLSKTDINQIALDIFESFSDLASRNEIDYKFISKESGPLLLIDQEKIKTILFNLLSNAFKFTPINGSIELKIEVKDQQLKLSISDSGKGIDIKEKEKVFERFYQTGNNKTDVTGTGIGLTLSLEYAKLHQGTIQINSEVGKGSCFTLQLPVSDTLKKDNEELIEINSSKEEQLQTTRISQTDQIPKDARTILIVDDNPDILDFIELNLSPTYIIIRANSGEEGLEQAIKKHPSIIISDVMMPGFDGNTLCRKLKNNATTMHIPIILLTAKILDEDKIQSMQSGADIYITKPFTIEYLTACINNVLKRDEYLLQYARNIISISPSNELIEDNNQDTIFVKRVMEIIENNITNTSFSVESLADEIGLSTTHLYRKLKTITSYSTKDIIKNYRLEKAAKMLSNKEGNITEIMYNVGFSSLSTFSKAFKSHFGKSPTEYIKSKPGKNFK